MGVCCLGKLALVETSGSLSPAISVHVGLCVTFLIATSPAILVSLAGTFEEALKIQVVLGASNLLGLIGSSIQSLNRSQSSINTINCRVLFLSASSSFSASNLEGKHPRP